MKVIIAGVWDKFHPILKSDVKKTKRGVVISPEITTSSLQKALELTEFTCGLPSLVLRCGFDADFKPGTREDEDSYYFEDEMVKGEKVRFIGINP